MTNHLYQHDLPEGLDLGPVVAIDCETMGLNPARDRLCVIQMSAGDGDAHLVQVAPGQTEAPNLCRREKPALRDFGNGHRVACHYAGELTPPLPELAVPA